MRSRLIIQGVPMYVIIVEHTNALHNDGVDRCKKILHLQLYFKIDWWLCPMTA